MQLDDNTLQQAWDNYREHLIAGLGPSWAIDDLRRIKSVNPGFKERLPQLEMTKAIEDTLSSGNHAIIEAPTGVGKSFAYLVPTSRYVNRLFRVIISTSSKVLQDQLLVKDIPFVRENVTDFDAIRLKGLGNYICMANLEEAINENGPDAVPRDLVRIQEVMATPEFSGEIEKLGFALPPRIEQRVKGDDCIHEKCKFYGTCPIMKQRKLAKTAQVVVVNHSLLAYNAMSNGRILGEYDMLIVDEAHELETAFRQAYTEEISKASIERHLSSDRIVKANKTGAITNDTLYAARMHNSALWPKLEQLFMGSRNPLDMLLVADKIGSGELLDQDGLRVAGTLQKLAREMETGMPLSLSEHERALYEKEVRAIDKIVWTLKIAFSEDNRDHIGYVKNDESGKVKVAIAPVDIASIISSTLLSSSGVIFTSATLSTVQRGDNRTKDNQDRASFSFFKRSIGLGNEGEVNEKILSPVFSYKQNSILYYPERTFPERTYTDNGRPKPYYVRAIAQRMRELVTLTRGRAFLLFTSRVMLDAVYSEISQDLQDYNLLRQGDGLSRDEMVRSFKSEPSILFGLKSFWEGVDIQGNALVLVAIDALPFQHQNDPLYKAQASRLDAGKDFTEINLPQAILMLKQGVGRLIRTETDRGIMAILDVRLVTKSYGPSILKSLPPACQINDIGELARQFENWSL